ncbi:MAG: HAD family hydrolase [Candidatus Lokiarchaeota archaeon]|nr:HAD family hydrolase [Candidatus Lokiarchaeota archaeon]
MPKDPAVFVFDVDGCILDSIAYFATFVPSVYEKFGIKPSPEAVAKLRADILQLLSGKSSRLLILKLILHSAKAMGLGPVQRMQFLAHLKRIYDRNVLEVGYVPGALETVRGLKDKGYKVALFTTGSAKDFRIKFRDKQDLVQLLDDHVVRDDVKHMKPDPEGLLLIKQHLGIADSRRMVMVGDMHHDVEAGVAAGALTIGVKTGVCSEEELRGAGAAFVFDSVRDILPNLARIEAKLDVA